MKRVVILLMAFVLAITGLLTSEDTSAKRVAKRADASAPISEPR